MKTENSNEEVNDEHIARLEKRVTDLEEQMRGCLRWMRYQAEKEAQKKDPDYQVLEPAKA